MLTFQYKYNRQKKKLAQLNRCRIWLNITTLSDIIETCEKRLCSYALKGEKYPHRRTKYNWRNQNDINLKYWKVWTKAIKTIFTTDGIHLKTPPRDWLPTREESQT